MGAPKITIRRAPPDVRPVVGLTTTVWYVPCVTERGPVGTPTLVTGSGEFRRIFGDMLASPYWGPLQLSRAFKGRGTKRFWINRIVHFTDPDDVTTKASAASSFTIQTAAAAATSGYVLGTIAKPYNMTVGDTIHVVTDAASGTMTLAATRALRESTGVETFDLENGWTLTVKIDKEVVAQTITFLTTEVVNIDAVTAQEAVNIINAKIVGASATVTGVGLDKITITSDTYGLDSYVEVTGGLANGAFNFNVAEVQGTGNVGNINAVGIDDLKTGIELACAGVTVTDAANYCKITRDATGSTKTVQVHSDSTGDDEVGLDNAVHAGTDGTPVDTLKVEASSDGTWGDDIDVQAAVPATNGIATEFDLIVRYGDKQVERWNNMKKGTANVDDPAYCETIVNGFSDYVTLTDTAAVSTLPDTTEHALASGNNGLAALAEADFTGEVALDSVFAIADAVMNFWPPDRTNLTTIKTIADFCETNRYFLVFDPPGSNDPATFVAALIAASLKDLTELAEVNYPWVKIANPDKSVFGQTDLITIPPSGGVVAAAITQDNKKGGVHEAYCGVENGLMADVVGLEYDIVNDYNMRDYLCSNRINVIHKSKAGLYYLDNTDTLKITDSFPSIGESRGTLYIEKVLDANLEWITNKNITSKIYRQIYSQIKLFLLGEMYNGAFYYDDDADASFTINVGADINPASERYKGTINIKIALAKANPVKDVNITISKDVREVMAEILGS